MSGDGKKKPRPPHDTREGRMRKKDRVRNGTTGKGRGKPGSGKPGSGKPRSEKKRPTQLWPEGEGRVSKPRRDFDEE